MYLVEEEGRDAGRERGVAEEQVPVHPRLFGKVESGDVDAGLGVELG